MKSSAYPASKRGDFTGQGEIDTYLARFGGKHSLVRMLARHSLKARDVTSYTPRWLPLLIKFTCASTCS